MTQRMVRHVRPGRTPARHWHPWYPSSPSGASPANVGPRGGMENGIIIGARISERINGMTGGVIRGDHGGAG